MHQIYNTKCSRTNAVACDDHVAFSNARQPFMLPLNPSHQDKRQSNPRTDSNANALVCCVMALLPMLDNVKLHIALMRISMQHIPAHTHAYICIYIYMCVWHIYMQMPSRAKPRIALHFCADLPGQTSFLHLFCALLCLFCIRLLCLPLSLAQRLIQR